MSPERLLSLQHAFRDAVLDTTPATLAAALRISAGDKGQDDGGSEGTIENRIAVYRHTVQASLIEVLTAAYPVVARIVGRLAFADISRRFVRAQPPCVAHLSAYGAHFSSFIADDADVSTLPYLPDVARLEWAKAESYFAADAPCLDPARLGALAPDLLSETVFKLHPATRMVISRYPIDRIWRINQPDVGDIPALDMNLPETVLVSRKDFRVILRPIVAGDAVLVGAIRDGATLGTAFSTVQAADPAFDLQIALRDHLVHGTFRE